MRGAPTGNCMLRCGGKWRDCSQRTHDSPKGTEGKGGIREERNFKKGTKICRICMEICKCKIKNLCSF